MSIEADREAVLLARIERLSNDVEAQRKALERKSDECAFWRELSTKQTGRLDRLVDVIQTLEALRNG